MINQVPLIVQNVFIIMGGALNVAPLQLKGPTSSQPTLMLIEGVQTSQGSGSSLCAESTIVVTISMAQPHSSHLNPDNASSFASPKSTKSFEPLAKDVENLARSSADPTIG